MLIFAEGGKTGKNPRGKGENRAGKGFSREAVKRPFDLREP